VTSPFEHVERLSGNLIVMWLFRLIMMDKLHYLVGLFVNWLVTLCTFIWHSSDEDDMTEPVLSPNGRPGKEPLSQGFPEPGEAVIRWRFLFIRCQWIHHINIYASNSSSKNLLWYINWLGSWTWFLLHHCSAIPTLSKGRLCVSSVRILAERHTSKVAVDVLSHS